MRNVHPEASPVRVPTREWRALINLKIKLRDQICKEMGQDAATVDRIVGDGLTTMAKLRLLGLTPSERVKAQMKYLTGADQESPPADLSGFTYSGGAGMTVTEIKAQIAALEQRAINRGAEDAYNHRYEQLMAQHGIVEDLSHLDNWVPPHEEEAIRAAEEQFWKDYPDAVPAIVDEPEREPVEEPVLALEPAPVEALEPAPVIAEEPAPEPAHELVEEPAPEPEPEPRPPSIEDIRGSIVLTPSYQEQ
jgi:hypothetical protein